MESTPASADLIWYPVNSEDAAPYTKKSTPTSMDGSCQ